MRKWYGVINLSQNEHISKPAVNRHIKPFCVRSVFGYAVVIFPQYQLITYTQMQTTPTIDDVKETDRPVLVQETPMMGSASGAAIDGPIHRPARTNGELETACGRRREGRAVVDHFEVRGFSPCEECFPDGVPFDYETVAYTYSAETGEEVDMVRVPEEYVPDGRVTLGNGVSTCE